MRGWFCFLFLFFAALPAAAKGRKPPELRFELDPPVVTAGRTLVVRFRGPAKLKNPRMTLDGRTAYFFHSSSGTWRAFWGVGSLEAPGEKSARVEALWRKKLFVSTVTFTVEAGTYPVSRVPLTKAQDNLITSGQLARDNEALSQAWAKPPIPKRLWSGYFVMPTTGVVSSVFGARRAYGNRPPGSGHSGNDIANDEGTPIVAPARGRVVFSRRLESFGRTVVLDHGQGVFTYYLHMKEASAREGAMLRPGDPIGLMGEEGIATGPHLHWTMVVAGEKVNAFEWMEKVFE